MSAGASGSGRAGTLGRAHRTLPEMASQFVRGECRAPLVQHCVAVGTHGDQISGRVDSVSRRQPGEFPQMVDVHVHASKLWTVDSFEVETAHDTVQTMKGDSVGSCPRVTFISVHRNTADRALGIAREGRTSSAISWNAGRYGFLPRFRRWDSQSRSSFAAASAGTCVPDL